MKLRFRSGVLALTAAAALVGALQFSGADMGPAEAREQLEPSFGKGDLLLASAGCDAATWPYLPAECLTAADGAPVADVRWVTVERRDEDNVSTLIRFSQ